MTRAFFAYGIEPENFDLPHPRIQLPVILIVRLVLLRAFERLRERGFGFSSSTEDEITTALETVIANDLLRRRADLRCTAMGVVVVAGSVHGRAPSPTIAHC